MMSAIRRSLFLLGCVLAASCASDAPYYRIEVVVADTVTLVPGESTPVEITMSRTGDVPGQVRLSLQNAPAGITLEPDIILPEGEETVTASPTLSVAVDTQALGLNRTLLLAEDTANDFAAAATFFIVVLPPPAPQPDFSIAVEPRQVDLFAGQSEQVKVTVTRSQGFTGPVTLSITSPTTRITLAEPVTITSEQTFRSITLLTDRAVTRVPVPITVVATSEDGRQATTGLTLNIR